MTKAEDLTINAFIDVRDRVGRAISAETGTSLSVANQAAEILIRRDWIDVDSILNLP